MVKKRQKRPAPVMDQEMLKSWTPLAVVMDKLAASERTVNRMVERGKLQQGYLQMPGRRPAPVFNPVDVDALFAEQESAKSFPVPASAGLSLVRNQPQVPAVRDRDSDLLDALPVIAEAFATAAATSPAVLPSYVDIDMAVKISGLPRGFLIAQAKATLIGAKKIGKWYFRRRDLEDM